MRKKAFSLNNILIYLTACILACFAILTFIIFKMPETYLSRYARSNWSHYQLLRQMKNQNENELDKIRKSSWIKIPSYSRSGEVSLNDIPEELKIFFKLPFKFESLNKIEFDDKTKGYLMTAHMPVNLCSGFGPQARGWMKTRQVRTGNIFHLELGSPRYRIVYDELREISECEVNVLIKTKSPSEPPF